jgi:hypothetical protein
MRLTVRQKSLVLRAEQQHRISILTTLKQQLDSGQTGMFRFQRPLFIVQEILYILIQFYKASRFMTFGFAAKLNLFSSYRSTRQGGEGLVMQAIITTRYFTYDKGWRTGPKTPNPCATASSALHSNLQLYQINFSNGVKV